ncbi:MAG: hypothetical protein C0467_19360 [Planctomycetaceae bacterium]|nr:hypothetical protein [Planctomycetaceae bacterium]
MSSALFGILQLDKGEPLGFAHISGLAQSWLQDAGGFAMIGLVVYLLYAMMTPTDKSQSEKIRVPVSFFMVGCAALAVLCYASVGGLYALQAAGKTAFMGMPLAPPPLPPPPPGMPIVLPPPAFQTELIPIMLMIAGTLALLGIGEPFARDMAKIRRRNLTIGTSGIRRFVQSVRSYAGDLLNARRLMGLGVFLGIYAVFGLLIFAFGSDRLFGIYLGVCIVGLTVFLLATLTLMLFEAEGPVWAIAKLSFKEAIRSQLLWVFLLIFLPFLFPAQWFREIKPSDELRVTVERMDLALTLLVLIPALLLASFYGIPNDIKNLNIYTVVSKPVEKFEIVLGRFVGYLSLMTLVLIGLTGVSLVLIMNTSISQRAKDETYKARVPVRGKLEFKSVQAKYRADKTEFEGTNVGREFDYRKYIPGGEGAMQRAIWKFPSIPANMGTAQDDRVPVEFTFDIFKLTKGEQNKGAFVSFRFVTHNAKQEQPTGAGTWPWADKQREKEYQDRKREISKRVNIEGAKPGTPAWAEVNKLAEEFGCFEYGSKEVFDYQVMGLEVPAGLFRNALQGNPGTEKDPRTEKDVPAPRVSVYVKCETPGQLLGMAEPDLYLLEYEQPFTINYVKGMVGLWCWLCILIGLAVACSTYLSGVLSLLVVVVIFNAGFFTDFINDLAANRTVGGGPFESMSRLMKAEQPTAPSSESAGGKALSAADKGWSWVVRRVSKVVPDLQSFDWSAFVAEGFNVDSQYIVVNLLMMSGYLLPWGILAYYLMKSREVAA